MDCQEPRSYMSVPPRSKITARRKLRGMLVRFLLFPTRFCCHWPLRQSCDEHLVHPTAIHVDDLEPQALPLEVICSLGDAPKRYHHESAQSFILIFVWEDLQVEYLLKLIHLKHAVQQPRSILTLGGLRLFNLDVIVVVFKGDLQRGLAAHPPSVVDDEKHLCAFF